MMSIHAEGCEGESKANSLRMSAGNEMEKKWRD